MGWKNGCSIFRHQCLSAIPYMTSQNFTRSLAFNCAAVSRRPKLQFDAGPEQLALAELGSPTPFRTDGNHQGEAEQAWRPDKI